MTEKLDYLQEFIEDIKKGRNKTQEEIPKQTGRAWKAVIYGEPACRASQKEIITYKARFATEKSPKARRFSRDCRIQLKHHENPLEGPVYVYMTIYYQHPRSPLDELQILKELTGYAYKSQKQIRDKRIRCFIDRKQPRVEIEVTPMEWSAGLPQTEEDDQEEEEATE